MLTMRYHDFHLLMQCNELFLSIYYVLIEATVKEKMGEKITHK